MAIKESTIVTIWRMLCFGVVLLGTHPAWAEDIAKPPSIMFEQSQDRNQITTAPPAPEGNAERCAALAARMEALKGRPQQRFTVAQQYEAECKR